MMSRSRGLPFAFLFVLLLPFGAAAGEMAFGQGVLWRLDKPGLAPSYVFGTFHSSDERVLNQDPSIDEALSASAQIALELAGPKDMGEGILLEMFFTDGRRLPDLIGQDIFAQVVETLGDYGIRPEAAAAMKPWAVLLVMSFSPEEMRRRQAGHLALDEVLEQQARVQGKAVHALETAAEQVVVFTEMPLDDQVVMLRTMFLYGEGPESLSDSVMQLYLRGDLARLFSLQAEIAGPEGRAGLDRFLQRAVVDRNRTMVKRALPLFEDGGLFMAVGAMHLPGEQGVLRLLEHHGYRASRIY
jgi:uncharacterized protein YbaP (TraB family)